MERTERRYPVGIQTFERLREEGYVYIDKTDLVWKKRENFVDIYELGIPNQEVRESLMELIDKR